MYIKIMHSFSLSLNEENFYILFLRLFWSTFSSKTYFSEKPPSFFSATIIIEIETMYQN